MKRNWPICFGVVDLVFVLTLGIYFFFFTLYPAGILGSGTILSDLIPFLIGLALFNIESDPLLFLHSEVPKKDLAFW